MQSLLPRLLSLVLTFCLLAAGSTVRADLISALTNGGFETNNGERNDYTVDDWGESSIDTCPLIWNFTQISDPETYPPVTGDGMLGFVIRNEPGRVVPYNWIFQSLGEVAASDVGLELTLSAGAGCRDHAGVTADIIVAFATGTDDVSKGTTLSSDDVRISTSGPVQGMYPLSAAYTPTTGDIGTTLYAVVSIEAVVLPSGAWQFGVDDVVFSQIPEPSSILLLTTGLIGLLCYAWRKRK